MYQKDEYGNEYRVDAQWIDAWASGGPYVGGFCTCELRVFADGSFRIHRGGPKYLKDESSAIAALHSIYLAASRELSA